jgi:hypothetical protein
MHRALRSPQLLWTAVVLASSSTVACTALNDTSQTQCENHRECRDRFAHRSRCIDGFCVHGPPPLGCLDDEPAPPRGEAVVFILEIWHATRGMPIPGVEVRRCAELDPECSTPLEVTVTDAEGIALLTAPPETDDGDRFFVEATRDGYVPTLYYIAGPWIDASRTMIFRIPLDMVTPAELGLYMESGGIDYDPSLGLVVMTSTDCEGWALPGVRLTAEPLGTATAPFLFFGLPMAVTSGNELTDGSGRGGFTNLPSGIVGVTAVHVDSGRAVGERSVLVRPGWWTEVRLSPSAAIVYEPRVNRVRL